MTTATATLVAYYGQPALKDDVMAQLAEHRRLDQIVQGTYWDGPKDWTPKSGADGRGCAVGCLTHDSSGGHRLYPIKWGIPEHLAWLEDRIFENLPRDVAVAWPQRFMGAVAPGADLSLVWPRLVLAMIEDPDHGTLRHAAGFPEVEAALRQVAGLWRGRIDGTPPDESARSAAESAAESAARSAAESAGWAAESARSAAESAAESAARSASESAAESAESAAESAESAAWSAHYEWMADTLIRLLGEAPLAETAA